MSTFKSWNIIQSETLWGPTKPHGRCGNLCQPFPADRPPFFVHQYHIGLGQVYQHVCCSVPLMSSWNRLNVGHLAWNYLIEPYFRSHPTDSYSLRGIPLSYRPPPSFTSSLPSSAATAASAWSAQRSCWCSFPRAALLPTLRWSRSGICFTHWCPQPF